MGLVVITTAHKVDKKQKATCHGKKIEEQRWKGDKNGNCAKLPGS